MHYARHVAGYDVMHCLGGPLMDAAQAGRIVDVRNVLTRECFPASAKCNNGRALLLAARNGRAAVVELLLATAVQNNDAFSAEQVRAAFKAAASKIAKTASGGSVCSGYHKVLRLLSPPHPETETEDDDDAATDAEEDEE
jgi:hypothetical protein